MQKEFIVQPHFTSPAKKGRLSLSINQDLLDRFEPYKQQINFSAQAEQMLMQILDQLENRAWVERNSEALQAHGRDIAVTGLAGSEFDRI
jgi:antitoxin CcdA